MKNEVNKFIDMLITKGLLVKNENSILLGESFSKKVMQKLDALNCIANYAIQLSDSEVKKGMLPVLEGDAQNVNVIENDGEVNPFDDSQIKVTNALFNVKEIITYIPVNNTILSFNKEGLEEFLSVYFAKCMAKTLNKIAFDSMKAKNPQEVGAYTSEALFNNVSRLCLANPKQSAIFVDKNNVDKVILELDKSLPLAVLGVPVVVLDGIEGVVIGDFSSSLANVRASELKIGKNISTRFLKNQTLITVEYNGDICVLDKNSYKLLSFDI